VIDCISFAQSGVSVSLGPTVTTQDVRSLGRLVLCVPIKSVLKSSQDEQEAKPVADHVSKCFNGGAGEVDHGLRGSSTALSRERQGHAYNIICRR
jgi:hypothetical protein